MTTENNGSKESTVVFPADSLYDSFRKPDKSLNTKPLFFWNIPLSEMTTDEVRRIVRSSYEESGYNGFGILPYWLDGYMSDEYFALYEAALDEGSKYGMQFSLYDEDGFPSYTAGGLFAKKYPELTARRLDMAENEGKAGEKVFVQIPEGTLMGAVAINIATGERYNITNQAQMIEKPLGANASSTCDTATGDALKAEAIYDYTKSYIEYSIPDDAVGTWKVMCFTCVNEHKEGMDYLNPKAVAGYIEIVHEAYYRRFKKYFDNGTITSSFYDEPSFYPASGLTAYGVDGARMWTDGLNEFFSEMYANEDPVLLYPALWYDIGEDTVEARDKLLGVRSEMFAKNYLGQVNEWCENHGIKLMGHMLVEEWVNPVSSEGDLMRCFKYQEIPGVDCIGFYGCSQETYKIISSSAYNWDKTLVMSETFGAMGPDMPVSTLYRQTIDLYTKGINLIVPHAVWYSDTTNVVYPPELSYRNPNYASALPDYNTYTARLSSILQQEGIHTADIAMLYPIDYLESVYYFNEQQNDPGDANYMQVGEYLSLTARRDFTYLHPDVLDTCIMENGKLVLPNKRNRESFKVFIIPGMKVISLSNLEKIYEFWKAGNPVIFAGTIPTAGICSDEKERVVEILTEMFGKEPNQVSGMYEYQSGTGKTCHVASEKDLGEVLDKALDIWDVNIGCASSLKTGYVSYIHKRISGRDVYYIGNSSDDEAAMTVKLRGEFKNLELWNPADGSRIALETEISSGATTVRLTLDAISSAFIMEPASNI